jgi:hypothetical protein
MKVGDLVRLVCGYDFDDVSRCGLVLGFGPALHDGKVIPSVKVYLASEPTPWWLPLDDLEVINESR